MSSAYDIKQFGVFLPAGKRTLLAEKVRRYLGSALKNPPNFCFTAINQAENNCSPPFAYIALIQADLPSKSFFTSSIGRDVIYAIC